MRTKLLMLFAVLGLMLSQTIYAQPRTVTGTVTDATTNETLPGVNVIIKNTTTGTSTDSNGNYSVRVSPGQILVFSSLGYETREVTVGAESTINVSLGAAVEHIEDVVVVAYGTQRRASLTGPVATVNVDDALASRPVTDVGRALQGSTPGLIITTTSGEIGDAPDIRIRGMVGTISGNTGSPLILVDQVEVPSLTYVNPDDIESISILKDGSTTAIYGPRAAFGAILITTKKGSKEGRPRISYSNNFSWGTPTNVPRHTRADLNLQYSMDQQNALSTTPTWEFGYVGFYYNPDVVARVKDWIDTYGDGKDLGRELVEGRDFEYRSAGGAYFYRPWDIYDIYYKKWAPQQNQNLSISGGNDKTQYNLSVGYMNQKGSLKLFDDFFKRVNTSGSVSTEVNKWLTVRANYMYAKTSEESPFLYASYAYGPIYYLYRWHQTYPYGTYNGYEFRGGVNDLKSARPMQDDSYYSRYTLGATLNLLKGLTLDFDYTYGQTFDTHHRVGGQVVGVDFWNRTTAAASDTFEEVTRVYSTASYDYAQYNSSKNLRNTYNGYLTYENTFGDHYLKAQTGVNFEDAEYVFHSSKRNLVYDFDKPEVNLAGGDQTASSSHNWWSVAGFYGRLNYAFKDRYILEVNGRYDGSSKFAAGSRWGFFPSASAAWLVTEEEFTRPLRPYLTTLKLRAAYGSIGNQDVPLTSFIPTLTVTNPSASGAYWLIGNNFVPYINHSPTSPMPALVDPTLTWEMVTTFDAGADVRFFNDKLGVTFDWYQRKTTGILAPGETVPATVGAPSARRNFGELTTNGVELGVDYNHTFSNGLKLTLTGGFWDYKTVVSKYESAEDPLISSTYYQGKVLGEIWGYKTVGLFQHDDFVWDGDEIAQIIVNTQSKNQMATGVPNQYLLESGLFKFSPGDVRFMDLNGNDSIEYGTNTIGNPGDRTVIGNTQPRYQFSFGIGADWKGIDMRVFFQGVGKRSIWATGNMVLPGWYGAEANFAHTLDYWTTENTDAFYPRPMNYAQIGKWNYLPNDRYLLNMAYMRLKNLTIGYTLPSKWTNKMQIDKVRIYFNGENLFEIDKMGNIPIDPEIDYTEATSADGRSYGRSYPYRRTIAFGVQVQF
jgi:TonB-linked SusC/RagA family outer membrane protein